MTEHDVQAALERANELLREANSMFGAAMLDESASSADQVLAVLNAFATREDLGDDQDAQSLKYSVLDTLIRAHIMLSQIAITRAEYVLSLRHAEESLKLANRSANRVRKANSFLRIANVYTELSDVSKALEYYQLAQNLYEELGNTSGIAAILANVGTTYGRLSDHTKSLAYHQKALALYEVVGLKEGVCSSLSSVATVFWHLGDYAKALEYHTKAMAIAEELGSILMIADNYLNIGVDYRSLAVFDQALEYLQRALRLFEEIGNKSRIALTLGNIGDTYANQDFIGYDAVHAEELLLKALEISSEIGTKISIMEGHKALAELYEQEVSWEKFANHFKEYHRLERDIHGEQNRNALNTMEQQREIAERETLLRIERAEASAAQNILHKVLPSTIAARLIKGEKVADYFQNVSILFADIVGFTPIASRMPAKAVLTFLNYVFGEFDRMAAACGCEKIKTIGDGYLAVAGAPDTCEDHAERIARLAIEMSNDIILPDEIRKTLPKGAQFNLRIGIHTGPAFGGIVGENRFVYDIYSDAVNLAARMESHGLPGKIHVSDEYCFHLQNRMDASGNDLGGIRFEEREEMEIKGKGMMRTYFLERA